MKDIVIIAPFMELYELANKVVEDKNYEDVEVIFGDLSQGVVEAKKAVKEGAKIIISRGGTYSMIKKEVDIPVVEIAVTSFDLLRGFIELKDYKGKIGLVGYGNVIWGSDLISELLNLDIVKIEINKEEKAEEVIKPYIDQGIRVFVGDTIGSRVSSKMNCKSYVIKTGIDSLISAIKDAQRVLMLSKAEQERNERFRAIVDFVHDGIISIDEDEKITLVNNKAKEMFKLEENVIGMKIKDVIPSTRLDQVLKNKTAELGKLQDVNGLKIATNRVPIIVDKKVKGVVATFNDVTELQELENNLRMMLSNKGFVAKYNFSDIVYQSEIMRNAIDIAKRYAKYDSPILITGSTGVGKELFSQSIHNFSVRNKGPFVAINCAALPANLIESELFGYVEGAFTGARKKGKPGLFELAHKGTIFLDEISELPIELQGRLLRILQEKEVMRIGDDKVLPVDVRIICGTNRNLKELVHDGKFRKDLYYRINILPLNIPDLKERRKDIVVLSKHFLEKYSKKYHKNIRFINDDCLNYLLDYDYQGNVRELEAMIERACILTDTDEIDLTHICVESTDKDLISEEKSDKFVVDEYLNLEELNKEYMKYVLSSKNGSVKEASKILGVDRTTIWRKLKE
ncbi:PAS domain S-box protein [Soehngenia saccharolytica]|nr:PAS domain S-box protein [Soehngenia saccharolytica]